jgi:hypothetical protein
MSRTVKDPGSLNADTLNALCLQQSACINDVPWASDCIAIRSNGNAIPRIDISFDRCLHGWVHLVDRLIPSP